MWMPNRQEKNNQEKNCKENQEKEIACPLVPVCCWRGPSFIVIPAQA